VTAPKRRLEAPHRRLEPGPRIVEKLVVRAFRTATWVMARVPPRPASLAVGLGAQLSYLAWPSKRRWSNANYGHVLSLSPDDPRVRRLALKAYRRYGEYLVEVMRLPNVGPDEAAAHVPLDALDGVEPIWRESPGGLIITAGHVGNNEAVAAGIAGRGWPINVLADDSAYPELFDDFRRMRESWGVKIIPWRNIREIYGVLKRREMLALLVDWGYRPDGIPVRLFDAWTTLPAGPATLAAKTRSPILPVSIRLGKHGFEVGWSQPIHVASNAPAELVRATQAMADALAATIAAAPEQWYSFKPLWPDTLEEQAALRARAEAALRGAGPAVGPETSADPAAAEATRRPGPIDALEAAR
jgi:phosphatidylinositol dimannoside acyltransferase